MAATVAADCRPAGPECQYACGWTAFPGRSTCCRSCRGAAGPHAKDCSIKNKPARPQCERGCGRFAFGRFPTCCTRCCGPEGPHSRDCAEKGQEHAKSTPADMEQNLRILLEEWRQVGAMQTEQEEQDVIRNLAESANVDPKGVQLLWLSVARQARPAAGSATPTVYPELAKRHHGISVEVVDLGQYSEKHSNSCMFLTCAATLAERRLQGREDAQLLGALGDRIEAIAPTAQAIPKLIDEHLQDRCSTLGRMADALRHAACELLRDDKEFFLPFFHPVHLPDAGTPPTYDRWVESLRGSEEGDELVILALAMLCGMAVQPVQKSGYRVPVMDPCDAKESFLAFWGNDDQHWVWLRPLAK
mmetsp:Transcript_16755/g.35253  ORF Transcript_16755/g.35253 Transcript_16755/m.35253 type:complete len:360 (-) Transcript_16755:45-1124(-)